MSEEKKGASHPEQLIRLKKIEGQIRGIQKMLEDRRYCMDILLQLSAINGAIKKVQQNILKRHLETCFTEAFTSGKNKDKNDKINEIILLIEKFNK